MKRKIFSLLLVIGLVTACGEIPKLENGQDALVSFNNGDKISVDDFYNQIKEQYGLSVLVSMVDNHLLKTKFPDYEKTAKSMAESYIQTIREDYTSEQEFLQDIQQYTGFATVEAYQEYMYLSYYERHATEEYIKENITDKQIEKYYKENIKEDIDISHILIVPDVTNKMTDDEKAKAEEAALKTANDIIKELKNTKSAEIVNKFAELAKKYSEDDATKDKNGSLGKVNVDTLGNTYKPLVDAAYKIKDGNIYTSVVKTTLGYHIVLRTKTYEKASLDTVKSKIIESIVAEELSTNKYVAVNALQHYRKELGMTITDPELNTAFNNYVAGLLSNSLNS